MITVTAVNQGAQNNINFAKADEYHVDDRGNLVLSTSLCQQVAVFAAGHWMAAVITPNCGPDGKFTKRGS